MHSQDGVCTLAFGMQFLLDEGNTPLTILTPQI